MGVSVLLFVLGFIVLITGARLLVKGATSVATILKISPWVIGVAIVGIGTSIPELSINISAVFAGNNVGIGAIIGSNTFNLLVILGLTALFTPIYIKKAWRKDILINVIVVIFASGIVLFPLFGNASFPGITRVEGGILFTLFLVWLSFMLSRRGIPDDSVDYQVLASFTSLLFVSAGILGVFIGGQWVVSGAEDIAKFFSVPSAVIGLTVVAVGTSLPELTVSLTALWKKKTGIAVGNIIGSNIFDFLGILGITALIKPLPILEKVGFDTFATVAASLLVALLAFGVGQKGTISRTEGLVLVASYVLYLVFVFANM